VRAMAGNRVDRRLSGRRVSIRVALALALALLVGGAPGPARAQRAPAVDPETKIAPEVRAQVATSGAVDFWLMLSDQADLRPAGAMVDRRARGRFVVDQLKTVADQEQAGLLALLGARGVDYQPFWIVNAVRVRADAAVLA